MPEPPETLSPELEARLRTAATADNGNDFDSMSWLWMLLLGAVVPIVLLWVGWLIQ